MIWYVLVVLKITCYVVCGQICCAGRFVLVKCESLVAKEPTGAREELVTDRARCRAVATRYECFCGAISSAS